MRKNIKWRKGVKGLAVDVTSEETPKGSEGGKSVGEEHARSEEQVQRPWGVFGEYGRSQCDSPE